MDNSQGLINNESNEIETDKSISKISILAVIGIIFSFLFGYFLKLFILEAEPNFLLFSFLAGIGFLAFFLLLVFFIKTRWLNTVIIFLQVLAFSAPFYDSISKIFGLGVLISFLILLAANHIGRRELENMLNIKFWMIAKKTLPKAIVGLAVFIGIVYVGAAEVKLQKKEVFISQTAFEKILWPISKTGIIQRFIPGFDFSLKVEELIKNLTQSQIEGNQALKILPQAARNELINQTAKEFEKEISGFIGSPVNPKAKVSEAIYEIAVNKIGKLPDSARSVAPMIAAGLIFLIIISLSFFIRLISAFLAFLVYEMFLAFGFGTIMMEGKSREIIMLK